MKSLFNPADANIIRSLNGKWHGIMLAFNDGRSYTTSMCGKTIFRHRKSELFEANTAAFDEASLTCKRCIAAVRKAASHV